MQVSILLHIEAVLHYVARVAGNERFQSALPQGCAPSAYQQRKSWYSLVNFHLVHLNISHTSCCSHAPFPQSPTPCHILSIFIWCVYFYVSL